MYHLEIISSDEMLLLSKDFKSKIVMMIEYNRIKNNLNTCNQYKGCQMQLFEGVDYENMKEITRYRVDF